MGFEPSAETNQYWVAYLVCLLTFAATYYFSKGESAAEKASKKSKKDRLLEGLKLILEDVAKKDEKHDLKNMREEGLPEASRVFGFLYDGILEVPASSFGIAKTDQSLVDATALLNRTFHVEANKAKDFTKKAFDVSQFSRLRASLEASADPSAPPAPIPLERQKSGDKSQEEKDFEAWIKEKKTTKTEVMQFLSGEKLDTVIELSKTFTKALGSKILTKENHDLVKECTLLKKNIKRGKRAAMTAMLDILMKTLPAWILAVLIAQVHPYLWFQYDRYVTGKLIHDAFDGDGKWNSVVSYQGIIDVTILCACWHFTNVVSEIILADAKRRFTQALKGRFIECLMYQDFEYFEIHGIGALQTRLNRDVEEVAQSMLQLPYQMTRMILGLLGSFIYVLYLVPYDLVLASLVPLAIIGPANNEMRKYVRKLNQKLQKTAEATMSGTMDAIINIEVVRGFATEREEVWKYKQAGEVMAGFETNCSVLSGVSGGAIAFFFTANLGILSYLCSKKIAEGTMKVEDCGVFLIQIGLHATGRVMGLLDMVPQVQRMLNPLYRVVDHLGAESKIEPNPNQGLGPNEVIVLNEKSLKEHIFKFDDHKDDSDEKTKCFLRLKTELIAVSGERIAKGTRLAGYRSDNDEEKAVFSVEDLKKISKFPITLLFRRGLMPAKFEGNIEFSNVKFTYPRDLRNQIYKGVSFKVEKGQKIGVCGAAGCGKSTGFALVQRLYDVDPAGGPVLIDGIDIRDYDVHYLRERIAIVQQKCVLFKTSVRDNILYGLKIFGDDQEGRAKADKAVIAALKLAQAWEFIDKKPDKLLTMVSETGGGFSGGQKQRLAIARVLIRKPDVILLDEATAALDPVNERAVQDTLDRVMKGFTVIAVAHRLTTIKDSDKIVVLDDGYVVEEGTHDELLKIPITQEEIAGKEGEDSGSTKVKTGFYRTQWETQFKEKGMTNDKLRCKIEQLQEEISIHESKIHRTNLNMMKWKAASRVAGFSSRFHTGSTPASNGDAGMEEHHDPPFLEMERFFTPDTYNPAGSA